MQSGIREGTLRWDIVHSAAEGRMNGYMHTMCSPCMNLKVDFCPVFQGDFGTSVPISSHTDGSFPSYHLRSGRVAEKRC